MNKFCNKNCDRFFRISRFLGELSKAFRNFWHTSNENSAPKHFLPHFQSACILLTIIIFYASTSFAEDASSTTGAPANSKTNLATQSATKVYPVKEDDLEAPDTNIPPPDFKEFENDKFIDDLTKEIKAPLPPKALNDKSKVSKDVLSDDSLPPPPSIDAIQPIPTATSTASPDGSSTSNETNASKAGTTTAGNVDSNTDKTTTASQATASDTSASTKPIDIPLDSKPNDAKPVDTTTPNSSSQAAVGSEAKPAANNSDTAKPTDTAAPATTTNNPLGELDNVGVAVPPAEQAATTTPAPTNPTANPATVPAVPDGNGVAVNTGGNEKPIEAAKNSDLTPAEIETYKNLNAHLMNFIASIKPIGDKNDAVAAANTTKANENTQKAPGTDIAQNIGNTQNTGQAATPELKDGTAVNTPQQSSNELLDEISGSQENKNAGSTTANPDANPDTAKTEAPNTTAAQQSNPVNNQETKPAGVTENTTIASLTPNIIAPKTESADKESTLNLTAPKVDSLPEPKEVKIDEKADTSLSTKEAEDSTKSKALAKPVQKELSAADKAYIAMLEKRQNTLPDDKRLPSSIKDVMTDVQKSIAPTVINSDKKYIKIERDGKGKINSSISDNTKKSLENMEISVKDVVKGEDNEKSKVKLEKAYKAMVMGQLSAAINIYKTVLDKEPDDKDALFGLATAYHKNRQLEQARNIYTKLLKKEPGNKEALNNFLVLVAEEAPLDALIELEKLERINSDFSPIPAQIAMINLKLGNSEKAARYLRRAILLSPDNVSYKYNLAITYDKLGKNDQALQLYKQVLELAKNGQVIPGSVEKLSERMAYLESKNN